MLRGDFLFQFPVSFLSCHLKPPHLQTSYFKGWGDMAVDEGCHCTVPMKCWDAFEMTLLDFKYSVCVLYKDLVSF